MASSTKFPRALALLGSVALATAFLVAIPQSAQAVGTTYYVNNLSGSGCSNASSGTSTSAPWCDFANVNSRTFVAGDSVLLARGATWTSTLRLAGTGTSANWITLGAYGAGALPIVRGTDAATDRTVILTNPDYWRIQHLEVSHAGMGVIVNYSTLGHQGLQVTDLYAHDITAIMDGSPAQSDYTSIQNSTGLIVGGLTAPPVPTASQWVAKDIVISNYRTNNTNPFYVWTMQSGGLYSDYPTNSVQNVTVQNSNFANMPAPGFATEAAQNINFFSNQVDCAGHQAEPQGTTCFFLWRTSNITFANNVFKNMPDTGSPDETAIDAEGYVDHVITRGNYFTHNAGAATEYLQLGGRPGDYSTNHESSDNAFAANGTGSSKLGTSLWVEGGAGVTGTLSNNLSADANGLTSGSTSGMTLTNNLTVAASDLFSAPGAFGSTQGANAESYELDSSGSLSNLSYDSSQTIWGSTSGYVGQFDTAPTTSASQWMSRTWTASVTGTVSIRGRALKSALGGDGVRLRITRNGVVIWPTSGSTQSLGAADQVGVETAVDAVPVTAGDKIRFEVNSGLAADATSDATSWAPSIAYTSNTAVTQSLVTAATPGTLRNDSTSLAGMSFTTGPTVRSVGALGRYFVTGNSGTHVLTLYANGGATSVASCSVSMSSGATDSRGFDYCVLTTPVALAANTSYYLVAAETAGGDSFSNDNSSIALSAGTRNSSIYRYNGTWGTGTGAGSYGPVNLLYTSSLLTAATPGTTRNNFTGKVGIKFTTPASGYYATSLGRYFTSGNTGMHVVGLYRASDGAVVSSCTVDSSAGAVDSLGFDYCTLTAPAVLAANTAYYLASSETSGGDSWSDDNSSVTLGSGIRNSSIYQSAGTWSPGPGAGAYGPVNLR